MTENTSHSATQPAGGGAHKTRRQNAETGFTASKQLTDRMQLVLVDLIELHLQGKQAHWNVVGHNFRDLHLQLDADLLHAIIARLEQLSWMVGAENRTPISAATR